MNFNHRTTYFLALFFLGLSIQANYASDVGMEIIEQHQRKETKPSFLAKIKPTAILAAKITVAVGLGYLGFKWYRSSISNHQRQLLQNAQAWYDNSATEAERGNQQQIEQTILANDTRAHPYANYIDRLEQTINQMQNYNDSVGSDLQTRDDLRAYLPRLRAFHRYLAVNLRPQLQQDQQSQREERKVRAEERKASAEEQKAWQRKNVNVTVNNIR